MKVIGITRSGITNWMEGVSRVCNMCPPNSAPNETPDLTDEGPKRSQNRIIGVELTMTDPMGVNRELEMFSCKHTFQDDNYAALSRLKITVHTYRGDITTEFPARPGVHTAY